MGYVRKSGGKKQLFSSAKIKNAIEKAAKDAGVSSGRRRELQQEVAKPVIEKYRKRASVRSSEIRKTILGRLDRRSKSVSSAWRRFDRKR